LYSVGIALSACCMSAKERFRGIGAIIVRLYQGRAAWGAIVMSTSEQRCSITERGRSTRTDKDDGRASGDGERMLMI
jgi:hypothetical protein